MKEGGVEVQGGYDLIHTLGDRNLRLKPNVKLHSQAETKDQYVVESYNGEQFFYCDADTVRLMRALDGHRSLKQVIDELQIDHHCYPELEKAISKFIKYGLLSGFEISQNKRKWWQSFKQPIAMKFPLFNPDAFLNHIYRYTGSIFNRFFIVLFISLLSLSIYLLPLQWESIQVHWQSRFFDPVNGLLLACAYVFLKALHEIAHGLVVKRYGGVVNECGVFMLVFIPLPYVDTSSSYAFPERRHRLLVGAAGMWVELIIAMSAFLAWQNSTPGYWADFLFNVVFVGSFSTLIFNLNPLMRFDGYYILSDYLGVFNLNARSREALGAVVKKFFFKLDTSIDWNISNTTKGWLIAYALCAAPYRLFIGLVIALYLSGKFFIFGILLALWLLLQILVFPIIRHAISVYQNARKEHQTIRFFMVVSVFIAAVLSTVFLLNFRFTDSQIAMVITPENQSVMMLESGVVVSLNFQSGQQVEKGQLLVQLENQELLLQLKNARGLLDEYKSQYRLVGLNSISIAQSWQEKISIQQKEVELIQQRLAGLSLVAPANGEFVLSREKDLLGRYLPRGEVIAHVYKPEDVKVLAVVSEEQVRKLNSGVDSIEVKFNTNPYQVYKGSILRIEPAAKNELPSRFLGSSAGGEVPVDSRDQTGLKSISPFFVVEIVVKRDVEAYMPAMGTVRFSYKEMTLSNYVLADIYHNLIQSLH